MCLSEPAFACLEIAKRMEMATRGAFSATATALQTQASAPLWRLLPEQHSIVCDSGRLQFDLGAIGKGFALDRMAELLRNWDCPSFLLVAGGSSILAGDAPKDAAGWSCGLGDDNATQRFFLTHASLSGSGLAVKGSHIVDPRTGRSALRQNRAWALTDTAAESDALSTACMVLSEPELEQVLAQDESWLVFLETDGIAEPLGCRALPPKA
jgi:thiamine biosynthesis lipoprotein